ncbi:MAG: 4-(cytidine 5'-diphospho)-2-C-methyl-D-erythritol kinase [Mesorhizobium sp.]|nr:4-(cytidine 5'-diphospho)-2-C-methyl-D-erythritol kinase [Mesorhizobium sp.]
MTPAEPLAEAVLAPAKVNLALHVTGRRPDGYHTIESLAVFTRFGDRLHLEPAAADAFSITGPFSPGLPDDQSNLVLRARDALRLASASNLSPVSIRLEKNLPVASGVGGGSSDAAAVLKALNQIWNCGLGQSELAEIARSLGADVPMCLSAKPLIATGIGDVVEPISGFPALALVLVNPGVAVSTPEIFQRLERRDNEGLPPPPSRIHFHSLRNWLETTHNHLEPTARGIQPAIGEILKALDKAGSGFSRMSGSGATCFGLFETGNVAKRAAVAIRARHPGWFVAATRSIAWEGNDGVS